MRIARILIVAVAVLLGLTSLGLAFGGVVTRARLLVAAAILAIPWLGMFAALLFPDTAAYDPKFEGQTIFLFGMHGQLFLALVLIAVLGTATIMILRTSQHQRRARIAAAPNPVQDSGPPGSAGGSGGI